MAKYSIAEEQEAAAPGDRVAAVSPDAAVDAPPPANDQAPEAEAPPVAPEPEQAPAADAAPTAVDEGPPLGRDGKPLYSLGDNVPPDTAMPQPKKDKSEDDIFGRIGEAIHGGITGLMDIFGLSDKDAAVRDPARFQQGQKAVVDGLGAGKPEDIKALQQTVDPEGRLTHAQVMIQAMTEGYEYYMERGDPTRANNYAAMIIQYSAHEASVYASKAVRDLRAGNMKGAAENASRATSSVVGQDTESTVVHNPQTGNFDATEKDVMTGKTVAKHELTGQQLFNLAMGAANKSSIWQGLMDAASSRPGQTKPAKTLSPAAIAAIGSVNGGAVDDEGIPRALGGAAGGVTSGGNAPGTASQTGDLISHADLGAMHHVESAGNANAVSPKGAEGLSQTMPKTQLDPGYGVRPAQLTGDKDHDLAEKQRVGDDYLQALVTKYGAVDGHIAYNWGPGNMEAWVKAGAQPNKLPDETRDYLARIALAQRSRAGGAPSAPAAAPPATATRPVQVAANTVNAPATDAGGAPAPPVAQAVPVGARPQIASPGPIRPQTAADAVRPGAIAPADQLPAEPVEAPTAVPEWAHIDKKYLPGLSAQEAGLYKATVKDKNALLTKGYLDQKKVNNDTWKAAMADHRAQLKELTGETAKPLVFKDRAEAMNIITPVVDSMKAEPEFAKLSPAGQKAIPDATFGIAAANSDLTPAQAAKFATTIIQPGISQDKKGQWNYSIPFKATQMPNPNLTRVQLTNGRRLVVPTSTYNEMMVARGNEIFIAKKKLQAAGVDTSNWGKVTDAGSKFVTGLGKTTTPKGVAEAVSGIAQADKTIADTGSRVIHGVGRAIDKLDPNYNPNKPEYSAVPIVPTI